MRQLNHEAVPAEPLLVLVVKGVLAIGAALREVGGDGGFRDQTEVSLCCDVLEFSIHYSGE